MAIVGAFAGFYALIGFAAFVDDRIRQSIKRR